MHAVNFGFSDYHAVFKRSKMFLVLFQHESLSVEMFQHLVKKNKLDTEFSVFFKEDLKTNKIFITELIEGLTKDERKVHEIILYDLGLKTVMHILIHFVYGI